jgi:hypothetical protein
LFCKGHHDHGASGQACRYRRYLVVGVSDFQTFSSRFERGRLVVAASSQLGEKSERPGQEHVVPNSTSRPK